APRVSVAAAAEGQGAVEGNANEARVVACAVATAGAADPRRAERRPRPGIDRGPAAVARLSGRGRNGGVLFVASDHRGRAGRRSRLLDRSRETDDRPFARPDAP